MDFSRRGTLFGLMAFAGTAPATPGLAKAFDYAFADDVSAAPGCLPALFGARERVIDKPGQLFPEAAGPRRRVTSAPMRCRKMPPSPSSHRCAISASIRIA